MNDIDIVCSRNYYKESVLNLWRKQALRIGPSYRLHRIVRGSLMLNRISSMGFIGYHIKRVIDIRLHLSDKRDIEVFNLCVADLKSFDDKFLIIAPW